MLELGFMMVVECSLDLVEVVEKGSAESAGPLHRSMRFYIQIRIKRDISLVIHFFSL
jgi:hypothetical protein